MKRTRKAAFRALSIVLAALMLLSMCGCSVIEKFIKKPDYVTPLVGKWSTNVFLKEDDMLENLQHFNFYEEEIALADLEGCSYVYVVELKEDGTYYMGIDEDATIATFTQYIDDLFTKMYENKDNIEIYNGYFADITSADAFKEEYGTNVYSFGSYDEMLNAMITEMYGFYTFDQENGTFTAEADKIHFTVEGETQAEYVEYTLDGSNLTLVFNDVTRVYTK